MDFSKIMTGWGAYFFEDMSKTFENLTDWEWLYTQLNNLRSFKKHYVIKTHRSDDFLSVLTIMQTDLDGVPLVTISIAATNDHDIQLFMLIDPDKTFAMTDYRVYPQQSQECFKMMLDDCYQMSKQKLATGRV